MEQLTFEEVDRLDTLISESMQLFFDLEANGVEGAEQVLLRGTEMVDD